VQKEALVYKFNNCTKVSRLTVDSQVNRTSKKVMSVKIDKSSNPRPLAPSGDGKARAPAAKSAGSAPSSSAASGTSVNIGTTSAQLQSMESSMASAPLVNAAKVAEIKQAISEGRFKVDASVVADSLIRSVTDLISSHKA
jgi:negative regulator of flagellin synthesis FlgM